MIIQVAVLTVFGALFLFSASFCLIRAFDESDWNRKILPLSGAGLLFLCGLSLWMWANFGTPLAIFGIGM